MKKIILILLSAFVILSSLAGCTRIDKPNGNNAGDGADDGAAGDGANTQGIKTGFAVVSSISNSLSAAEATGLAQVDSNAAAVLLDTDGKIIKCVLDAVQTKVVFDENGKITTALDTAFDTKKELGEDYGMKKFSAIGKEWNQQAKALEDYVVGKTVNQIKGIAVDPSGYPTDADLSASVTVSISGYLAVIEKAAANAAVLGATGSDRLGMGIVTNIGNSADAGDNEGKAQAYSIYSVITLSSDGKITSSVFDASQTEVLFDRNGVVQSDLQSKFKTKNELGEGYGMKKASGIGKEWNEQARSFADYIAGKTPAEVETIAVDESTYPTGADLTASVTVTIGGFQGGVKKAAATAK